ncbi:MAG: helix-turn-helix transcriptional regulator [Chitinophagaceae bacterium]|nr:helix-turn-helix transcriptional regulator [Chitinophagaceae bacterium]
MWLVESVVVLANDESLTSTGKFIGITIDAYGRYERNEVKPSIEVATKMAKAIGVSLDYLVGFADYELNNTITQKILDIQKLNDEDKNAIIKTIDALLRDAKARKAYAQ